MLISVSHDFVICVSVWLYFLEFNIHQWSTLGVISVRNTFVLLLWINGWNWRSMHSTDTSKLREVNAPGDLILLSLFNKRGKFKWPKRWECKGASKSAKYFFLMCLFTQSVQVTTGDENWSKNTKMGLEEAATKEMTWFTLWSHLDLSAKGTSQHIDEEPLRLMESFTSH